MSELQLITDKTRRDDLGQYVSDKYGEAAKKQRLIIDEMELARMMYRGDQWLRYQYNKWVPAPEPKWRVRLVVNKLPPLVELSIATFMRYRPTIIAEPSTDEREDYFAAKVTEMLLRHYWDYLDTEEHLQEALRWAFICGCSFVRVRWDPEKGRKIQPQLPEGFDASVLPAEVMQPEPEGDLCLDVIDPFSMTFEPGARRFEDATWCNVTEFLPVDELQKRFDLKDEDVDPQTAMDESLYIPMQLESDWQTSNPKDRAALHSFYEKPNQKASAGRIVYVVNQKAVAEQQLPKGEVRIVQIPGIVLPGEAWPTSLVTQVIPLQMEVNRGRSQLIENRNLTSRPQMIAPLGSMDKDSMDNKPGNVNYFDPVMARNFRPEYLQPPSVPQWVMFILNLANEDMMDLASRHEASQGIQGSNITSGKQAAIFRSADDSRLAPQIRSFEKRLRALGRYMISTFIENAGDSDRVMRVTGRGRAAEVKVFQSSDVSEHCNVRYEVASKFPWARDSLRQQAIYLNQIGKLGDDELREILEFPSIQHTWEVDQVHRLNARNENSQLMEGGYFPPLPTDNHQVHLQEHEAAINTPENRMAFIAELQMQEQQFQMQAQQAQMMGKGGQMKKPKYPKSIQSVMRHLEDHRKAIPPAQPPPPAPKLNLSLDRLLQNPAVLQNPQVAQALIQAAQEMVSDASGQKPMPNNPPGGRGGDGGESRAPSKSPPGLPTPPGGGDVEGTGSTAALHVTPEMTEGMHGF